MWCLSEREQQTRFIVCVAKRGRSERERAVTLTLRTDVGCGRDDHEMSLLSRGVCLLECRLAYTSRA